MHSGNQHYICLFESNETKIATEGCECESRRGRKSEQESKCIFYILYAFVSGIRIHMSCLTIHKASIRL